MKAYRARPASTTHLNGLVKPLRQEGYSTRALTGRRRRSEGVCGRTCTVALGSTNRERERRSRRKGNTRVAVGGGNPFGGDLADPFAQPAPPPQRPQAPPGFVKPGKKKPTLPVAEADRILQRFEREQKESQQAALRVAEGTGTGPAQLTGSAVPVPSAPATGELLGSVSEAAEGEGAAGCQRPPLRASATALCATSFQVMMGIMAPDQKAAIQALKQWTAELGLPKGKLHGMDRNGVAVRMEGPVYVKYNSTTGDADMSGYAGQFRGVLFSPSLPDGEFRQYGYLPLSLFDAADDEESPAAPPPRASALLVDIGSPQWMKDEDLQEWLLERLPGADIRSARDPGNLEDIRVIALNRRPTVASYDQFPNLEMVQRVGAGVELVLADPALPPQVRVARLKPQAPAREIAEFCLAYVLAEQRHLLTYHDAQGKGEWIQIAPRKSPETVVGVLGLGHIGARLAASFAALGFQTVGWSRSRKDLEGVACSHGDAALQEVLQQCDYVICVLPSTPATVGLLDEGALGWMKEGSVLLNVGRGDLIVEADLIAALDKGNGKPSRAVLDVFEVEPLPSDHPFWTHPRITVTPHVSGWHVDDGLVDIVENYRRVLNGQPLLHEVNRENGY